VAQVGSEESHAFDQVIGILGLPWLLILEVTRGPSRCGSVIT